MRSLYFAYSVLLNGKRDWAAICRHASSLGFDGLLVEPHQGDIFQDDIALGLGIAMLAGMARDAGLALFLELRSDRVGQKAAAAHGLPSSETPDRRCDPRIRPAERDLVPVPRDPEGGRLWSDVLGRRLGQVAQFGAAGFRCSFAGAGPAFVLKNALAQARAVSGATSPLFIAAPSGLDGCRNVDTLGFDTICLPGSALLSPLPFDRLGEATKRVRHVFGMPEAPFGRRAARVTGDAVAGRRQAALALWANAAVLDGMIVPMGFEFGARERIVPGLAPRSSWSTLGQGGDFDLTEEIIAANAFLARRGSEEGGGAVGILAPQASPIRVVSRRAGGDAVRLAVVNRALDRSIACNADEITSEFGEFLPLHDLRGSGPDVEPGSVIALRPAEVRIMAGSRAPAIVGAQIATLPTPDAAVAAARLAIEAVEPAVDGGRYAVKRIVGETVPVEADAFGEGHDPIAVALKWRAADEEGWREARMRPLGNDRYRAELPLTRVGRYVYTVEAWRDEFAIFRSELVKKHEAGLALPLELEEGRRLVEKVTAAAADADKARLAPIARSLAEASNSRRLEILLSADASRAMALADPRPHAVGLEEPVPIDSERKAAGFASWYELFPRSQSGDAARHGTFDDVARRLPAIAEMGFDVVYFPPIHPIGSTNRKGRNNSLMAAPDDPGSPYAIGSEAGGHDAIHPELGSFEDFRRLVAEAARQGLEIALDLAIQASPDHPWLTQHPEWFDWRPDGTIRYAENPPKKYEDIVNVDFYAEGAKPSLWIALRDTVRLWVEQGVRLFRVDNPHTKPFPFWEWLIADIRREHPDVVFLSEAFTRPKVMYRLAKIGFSQSYTYFTWRNSKWELTQYLTELTQTAPKDFFRPHFFVNTHDINPDFLQNAPRSAFLIRAALATTLAGLWGMYNGFELCEGRPDARKKEYADSEKYELTAWDWDRPGNIVSEVTALNRIRRENPALQSHLGLTFLVAWNDNVLYFEKATPGRDNVVLIAISLDPHQAQEADIEIPLWRFGLPDDATLAVEDLMRDARFTWSGKIQRIRLDPADLPFSIWRLGRREGF